MAYTAKRPFIASEEHVIGTVNFTNAIYRNKPFEGTFDLIKGFQEGGNGDGFVTIREPNGKRTRVTVHKEDGYEINLREGMSLDQNSRRTGTGRGRGRPRKNAVAQDTQNSTPQLMTFAQAAEHLGISENAVRARANRGSLQKVESDAGVFVAV